MGAKSVNMSLFLLRSSSAFSRVSGSWSAATRASMDIVPAPFRAPRPPFALYRSGARPLLSVRPLVVRSKLPPKDPVSADRASTDSRPRAPGQLAAAAPRTSPRGARARDRPAWGSGARVDAT